MNLPSRATAQGPGFLINLWHALGLLFWVVLFRGLTRIQVQGKENIPARGETGALLLSNHISAIDPFVIAATAMPFFSPVWWRAPAKAELFAIPVLRNILRSWGAIPIRRGERDLESIELMTRLLPGSVIVAFPEGRRSTDGSLLPGRPGLGKVIYHAHPKKVIPIRIEGTERLLRKGSILPRLFTRVTIRYGRPVELTAYYRKEDSLVVSKQIINAVMEAIEALAPSP